MAGGDISASALATSYRHHTGTTSPNREASRAGPAQNGTATAGKGANRTGPEQSTMTSAEKGNDKNVAEAASEVFQKIQNDIIC
jgi:hypothetical protein